LLANRERIHAKMEEFDLDCLIASHPENVSYLSDFQSHHPYMYRFFNLESFALFPRGDDCAPALIISVGDAAWAARFPTWMEEVYLFGNRSYTVTPGGTLSPGEAAFKRMFDDDAKHAPTAGEVIVKALKQKGLDRARIGLDEKNISPATRDYVQGALPHAKFIEAFELFRVIRMVKTPEELDRLITVGLLNERAVMTVMDRVAEGVSEDELTQRFLESVAKEGAVFEFWNTASGTQSSMVIMSYGHFNPRSGYRLKRGDIFRYDGGSIYHQYHSDAGGCAVIGPPTERQRLCYRAIEAGMERAMELLRPGALPSKIFRETASAVEKAGIKEYPKIVNFVGHGIGIEARDYPIFTPPVKASSPFLPGSYDIPIEENMVISIEIPYLKELGLGGFQIEYTLLVKKNGCEKLYPHERSLVIR
jgi:Xaa-Pro dipeptidase